MCVYGYHSNDSERCERFLSDDSYIIECLTDTEFLGTGMYFWGTESDARWWMREKSKETIVRAVLNLDNMLDLTDQDVVKLVESALEKIDVIKWCEKKDKLRKIGKNAAEAPGVSLDAVFDSFSSVFGGFNIIKGRQFSQRNESNFFFGTKLTTKAVDIYCVKNSDPISEREKVAV